jgi:hypothetical protein
MPIVIPSVSAYPSASLSASPSAQCPVCPVCVVSTVSEQQYSYTQIVTSTVLSILLSFLVFGSVTYVTLIKKCFNRCPRLIKESLSIQDPSLNIKEPEQASAQAPASPIPVGKNSEDYTKVITF